jgi:hypothetical protein
MMRASIYAKLLTVATSNTDAIDVVFMYYVALMAWYLENYTRWVWYIGGGLNASRKATAVSSKNKAHKCDFCDKTFQFKSRKIWDWATFWNVVHKKI